MWSALAMVVAVFLPAALWGLWDDSVPGEEELPPGAVVEREALPPPMSLSEPSLVRLTIPDEGWSISTGAGSPTAATLVNSPVTLTVTAVAGVENMETLYKRQARGLGEKESAMFTTNRRDYTTESGLEGYWANLTGDNHNGVLVVVGKQDAAAVVVVRAPMGRLEGVMGDVVEIVESLEVSAEAVS